MIRTNAPLPGEAIAEPTPEQLAERQEQQGRSRAVQAKISEIQRGKVDSFLDDAKQHDGNFFQRAISRAREWGAEQREAVRDSREALMNESKWHYLLKRGSTFAIDSEIAKQELRMATIRDQQQREAKKFDDLEQKFKDGEKDIQRSKKKHLESYDKKLKDAEEKHEALKKQLEEKHQEIQEMRDKLNDRITKKIAAIKLESNYPANKEEQKRLKEEIIKIEDEIQRQEELHDKFSAISERLYGGSSIREFFGKARSEDKIFNEKLANPNAAGLTAAEKTATEKANQRAIKANSDIRKKMDDDKMSLENVAADASYALEFHTRELTTLKRNLAELKTAKEKIDDTVVHSERRMQSWEQHRRKLGIQDEDPGEHVKAEKFANVAELNGAVDALLDKIDLENRTVNMDPEYWAKLNSTEVLESLDTADKVKKHRENSKIGKEQVAHGLAVTRENADNLMFQVEQNLDRIESTLEDANLDAALKTRLEEQKTALTEAKEKLSGWYVGKIQEKPEDLKAGLEDTVDRVSKHGHLLEMARTAALNEAASTDRNKKIFELLDYSVESMEEISSPEGRIDSCLGFIEEVRNLDLTGLGLSEQEAEHLVFKAAEKAAHTLEEVQNPSSRIKIGFRLLEEFDAQGDMVNPEVFEATRDIMQKTLFESHGSFSEEERLAACGEYFEVMANYSERGRMDRDSSIAGCVDLRREIERDIAKTTADKIVAAKQIADISYEFADTFKGILRDGQLYAGFYKAMNLAEELSSDKEGEVLSVPDADIIEGDRPSANAPSGVEIKVKQTETINYIQGKLLEAGLKTSFGSGEISLDNINYLKGNVDRLRSVSAEEIDEYAQIAIDLESSGHFDTAMHIVRKIESLSEGNSGKLLEFGAALATSAREPMRNEAMGMYEKSFALVSGDVKTVPEAWNVIASMIKEGFLDSADRSIAEIRGQESGDFDDELMYPVMLSELVAKYVDDEAVAEKFEKEADRMFVEVYESAKGDPEKLIQVVSAMDKNRRKDAASHIATEFVKGASSEDLLKIPGLMRALQSESDFGPTKELAHKIAALVVEQAKRVSDPQELVDMVKVLSEDNFVREANDLALHFDTLIRDADGDEIYPVLKVLAESEIGYFESKANMVNHARVEAAKDDMDALLDMSAKLHAADIKVPVEDMISELYIEPLYQARILAQGNYENLVKFASSMMDNRLSTSGGGWLANALEDAGAIAKREGDADKINQVAGMMQAIGMNDYAADLLETLREEESDDAVSAELVGEDSSSTYVDTEQGIQSSQLQPSPESQRPKKKGWLSRLFGSGFFSSGNDSVKKK